MSGTGTVRHADGTRAVRAGDAFLFKPNEPHQLTNDGTEDLVVYVVADNPIGETCYYPDSDKEKEVVPDYHHPRRTARLLRRRGVGAQVCPPAAVGTRSV